MVEAHCPRVDLESKQKHALASEWTQ